MAQQTEYRAVIHGRHYVGFEVPGQFITIYRADADFKPVDGAIEGVWTMRSETIRWGTNHSLTEAELRQHFVKPNSVGATVQAVTPQPTTRVTTALSALWRDFTIPPMSIASFVLAVLMLFAGVLILIDAPELGPLLGGLVFGSALLLLLFAILGPFIW